jgi:hypothetical protein
MKRADDGRVRKSELSPDRSVTSVAVQRIGYLQRSSDERRSIQMPCSCFHTIPRITGQSTHTMIG